MYEILELENLKEFHCTGNKCPDNCCHSWGIHIDKNTYKKYKKNKQIKMDNIKIVDRNNNRRYAMIKLNDKKYCPFFNSEGLCEIHKNHGHQMLSNVCRRYPKKEIYYNNRIEKSYVLSCPAVVDLLFKSKKPLEFSMSVITKKNYQIDKNKNDEIFENFKNEDFFALRSLAITIMQYRGLSIKERLYAIGKTCNIISELIKSNNYEAKEIRAYIYELETTFMNEPHLKMPQENMFKDNEQYDVIEKILPIIKEFLEKESFYKNKTEFKKRIDNQLSNIDNIKAKEIAKFKQNTLDEFFKEKEYLLEHYIVYKLFENIFPRESESIDLAFNMLLNNLLILTLCIIALYIDKEKLTLKDFKNSIYFFERKTGHSKINKTVLTNLNEYLKSDWEVILDIIF